MAVLRRHEGDLRASGVRSLSVFGSLARGDETASDVDVAVRLDETTMRGGLSYFSKIEALRSQLEQILGSPVDIVSEPARRKSLQDNIDKDRLVAFS